MLNRIKIFYKLHTSNFWKALAVILIAIYLINPFGIVREPDPVEPFQHVWMRDSGPDTGWRTKTDRINISDEDAEMYYGQTGDTYDGWGYGWKQELLFRIPPDWGFEASGVMNAMRNPASRENPEDPFAVAVYINALTSQKNWYQDISQYEFGEYVYGDDGLKDSEFKTVSGHPGVKVTDLETMDGFLVQYIIDTPQSPDKFARIQVSTNTKDGYKPDEETLDLFAKSFIYVPYK